MNLNDAIQAHAQWKVKLRGAIQNQEQLDVKSISVDNCCPLGQWLHGDAKSQYSGLGSYADLVKKHAVFHQEAGKVATEINAKNYPKAESMLGSGTSYMSASSQVGVAIMALKKEAKI